MSPVSYSVSSLCSVSDGLVLAEAGPGLRRDVSGVCEFPDQMRQMLSSATVGQTFISMGRSVNDQTFIGFVDHELLVDELSFVNH